jgi:hypothetical protein
MPSTCNSLPRDGRAVLALEDASKVVDNEDLRLSEMRHDTGEFRKSKSQHDHQRMQSACSPQEILLLG